LFHCTQDAFYTPSTECRDKNETTTVTYEPPAPHLFADSYLTLSQDPYRQTPLINFNEDFNPLSSPEGHKPNPYHTSSAPLIRHFLDGNIETLMSINGPGTTGVIPDLSSFNICRPAPPGASFLWALTLATLEAKTTDAADSEVAPLEAEPECSVEGETKGLDIAGRGKFVRGNNPLMNAFKQVVEAKRRASDQKKLKSFKSVDAKKSPMITINYLKLGTDDASGAVTNAAGVEDWWGMGNKVGGGDQIASQGSTGNAGKASAAQRKLPNIDMLLSSSWQHKFRDVLDAIVLREGIDIKSDERMSSSVVCSATDTDTNCDKQHLTALSNIGARLFDECVVKMAAAHAQRASDLGVGDSDSLVTSASVTASVGNSSAGLLLSTTPTVSSELSTPSTMTIRKISSDSALTLLVAGQPAKTSGNAQGVAASLSATSLQTLSTASTLAASMTTTSSVTSSPLTYQMTAIDRLAQSIAVGLLPPLRAGSNASSSSVDAGLSSSSRFPVDAGVVFQSNLASAPPRMAVRPTNTGTMNTVTGSVVSQMFLSNSQVVGPASMTGVLGPISMTSHMSVSAASPVVHPERPPGTTVRYPPTGVAPPNYPPRTVSNNVAPLTWSLASATAAENSATAAESGVFSSTNMTAGSSTVSGLSSSPTIVSAYSTKSEVTPQASVASLPAAIRPPGVIQNTSIKLGMLYAF